MNFKQLFTEDRAVSPVIGVILMVAITVILAAVIGTFVLGLGDQVSETAPQAQFTFDFDDSADELTVTHDGGDSIEANRLTVAGDLAGTPGVTNYDETAGGVQSALSAGDSFTVATDGSNNPTVRVVWSSPNSDETATVAKFN